MINKKSMIAFAVLTFAILACRVGAPAAPVITQPVASVPTVIPADGPSQNPADSQETLVALYDRVSPGTVAIITNDGQGSGFVYDNVGHVVTNYHVVEGAAVIEVRFTSGFMGYGTVVGTDLD